MHLTSGWISVIIAVITISGLAISFGALSNSKPAANSAIHRRRSSPRSFVSRRRRHDRLADSILPYFYQSTPWDISLVSLAESQSPPQRPPPAYRISVSLPHQLSPDEDIVSEPDPPGYVENIGEPSLDIPPVSGTPRRSPTKDIQLSRGPLQAYISRPPRAHQRQ